MTKLTTKSGDLRIETLRGIAIIAVVVHHTNLWLQGSINQADVDPLFTSNLFAFFSEFFSPLRMPLFTVLSGWVYALKPVNKNNTVTFFAAKFRRVILPLFFVSTCYYFVILLTSNDFPRLKGRNGLPVPPEDFWVTWFYHFGHLWFLQLLISLFVIITIIDRLGLMNTVKKWLFWLVISAIISYLIPNGIELWSISHIKRFMLFFLFGVGLNRFQKQIFTFRFLKYAAIILICTLITNYFLEKNFWPLSIIIGTIAPIYLLSLNFIFQPFVWIGKYSYSIYLYHGIAWYSLKPICVPLLNNFQYAWALIFLFTGLFLPIIIEKIGGEVPIIRTLLIGRKPLSR